MVYNLYAGQTHVTLPDGTQVAMWGYGLLSYGRRAATPVTAPTPRCPCLGRGSRSSRDRASS